MFGLSTTIYSGRIMNNLSIPYNCFLSLKYFDFHLPQSKTNNTNREKVLLAKCYSLDTSIIKDKQYSMVPIFAIF